MSHVLYFLIKSASRADGIWEQDILIRRSRMYTHERDSGRKRGGGLDKILPSFGTDQLSDLLSSLLADRQESKDGVGKEN